ncbi:MAG: FdhF/YdeP family oxidoreductase [Planctomycetes bacterium]|nr:FdhF/YdeP family oxidoreductase [Planctomycetota bacterium]
MNPRIGPSPAPLPRAFGERLREWVPFGLLVKRKPRHFREMLSVAWENRGRWLYAWRILRHGVCDGCSLGPRGLRDDVIQGVHLCTTRLRLLRLNTMRSFDPSAVADAGALSSMSNEDLQALGRVPCPLVREKGDRGFRRASWYEALVLISQRLERVPGDRMAFFATSRGITNEAYYTFQKAARLMGSPHVDYCARLCHAPSGYGIADTMGVGAPTCSLSDMIGTDLLVLWGTNLANNQPVTTKYMHEAKRLGTRIVVVNPFREPGLERYWVPSLPRSALFGTRLMDDYYPVRVGGDIAFMNGILKALKDLHGFRPDFIDGSATGFAPMCEKLDGWTWETLERESGLPRSEMERFARTYRDADTAVFVYSMGLTQQRFGVENVRSIATLALARGMVGRSKCGVLPIRGHSGVQGGSEMGVSPDKFPGGASVNEENAAALSNLWKGCDLPTEPGLATPRMIEAAHEGKFDFLYSLGGNLLETMPDRRFVEEALARIPLRVHQDIVMNTSTLLPGECVVVLPAMTRYEQPGGCTSTSTERRIRFSPSIEGPRVPEAKPEWAIPCLVAKVARPGVARYLQYDHPREIREEIEAVVPLYRGIASLEGEGDAVQWGGTRLFEGGRFDRMPVGKARLWVQDLPSNDVPEGKFHVTTRRGKQFNSMVHLREDPLTGGAPRDAVFLCEEDAVRLGVGEGARVRVRSGTGEFVGRVVLARQRPGTAQLFWPEANVLIPRRYDPVSHEPDYGVVADVEAVKP